MTSLPEEYIANHTLLDVNEVLGQISCIDNFNGKNTYNIIQPGKKCYIGSDGMGYVNHFLYYSEITKKIYCMTSGMYNIIYACAIIESDSDFDPYI